MVDLSSAASIAARETAVSEEKKKRNSPKIMMVSRSRYASAGDQK